VAELHTFLTSAPGGGEQSASHLGRVTSGDQLDTKLSETQSWFGGCREETNLLPLSGIELLLLVSAVHVAVAVETAISRLQEM
jgi:hypothetical protein